MEIPVEADLPVLRGDTIPEFDRASPDDSLYNWLESAGTKCNAGDALSERPRATLDDEKLRGNADMDEYG